jgi:hypothetical protein
MSINCQKASTRSPYHWTQVTTADGRFGAFANGEGVPKLMGTIVKILSKNPGLSKKELLELLWKATSDRSLRMSDLSQPFVQLRRGRIVKMNGHGFTATWQLTPQGAKTWAIISKKINWI